MSQDISHALSTAVEHHQAGRLKQAESIYRQLLLVRPDVPDVHFNLGVAMAQQGRTDEAIGCYGKTIELDPTYAEAHYSLGNALRILNRRDEAADAYREAIRLRPDHAEAINNLANLLKDAGQVDEALAAYRRTIELRPDFITAHTSLLFTMNYLPHFSAEEIFRAHCQWYQVHAAPLAPRTSTHANIPDPDRRLRIGYVSGDLLDHAVAFFINPILVAHDRRSFDIFCYYSKPVERSGGPLWNPADHWRDVASLSDEQLINRIRQDGIDILVDLSGHTAHNRLRVFAQKPAPVQFTYLGYPNTTGVEEIDYRITDAWADPPGLTERYYSEKLIRLPHAFFCYRPDQHAPPVSSLPAASSGHITFASLNNFGKVTPQMLCLWAQILAAAPQSRLVMVVPDSAEIARRITATFESFGVGADRLEFLPRQPVAEYYKLYARLDIALDPFPFNGHTTTCDCLWMGVPVVTLAGKTAASRAGVSVLSNLDLKELIAENPQRYVSIAVGLANDPSRLADLRRNLRKRMQASILTDANRFTRNLETAYRRAWRRWCESRGGNKTPQAILDQAVAHHQAGRFNEAKAGYRQALTFSPALTEIHFNLGVTLAQQSRHADAIACYHKAIELDPNYADAHYSLGNALRIVGRRDEAMAAYQQAVRLRPEHAEALNNLANLLKDAGRMDESIQSFNRALALRPDLAETHYNLGSALAAMGRLDEAIACYNRAVAIKPDAGEYHSYLAGALRDKGRLDEAIASFRQALLVKPDQPRIHSALIFTMNCHPDLGADEIFLAHHEWHHRHAAPLAKKIKPHLNSPDPARRLRIGYVSGDFRQHSVAFFIAAVLVAHEHSAFEIFCYYTRAVADPITQRMRKAADHWRDVATLSDDQLADLIRQDQIDILVDLAGHTAHNRLLAFAQKPAPVQITYLGYPNTTGVEEIDYRITDAWADPPGLTERYYSEKLIRLPHAFFCYRPDQHAPPVSSLPAASSGHITFASLNSFGKVTPQMLCLWAQILAAAPQSRLVMVVPDSAEIARRITATFESFGVGADRLEFLPRQPVAEYYKLYARLDIALDPFPFNGHTTTCDCLWMGVPVVTLAGKTAASRAGVSVLSNLDLKELIAENPQRYVSIAVGLANDPSRLAELRRELRQRMNGSALMDARRFTRNLESAYRAIWRNWCAMALNNLAVEQLGKNGTEKAIANYRRAIALNPEYCDAHSNLGVALTEIGQLDEAMDCFERAVAIKPDHAEGHANRGLALLLRGDFERGWVDYEWRRKRQGFRRHHGSLEQPRWDGSELKGQRILLHAEQGLGDAIHFVRYVPMVAARGGHVILECPLQLERLFGSIRGVAELLELGRALPAFDVHCPLPSLPFTFGTKPESIPCDVPYLQPDPHAIAMWQQRMAGNPGRLKVGLVWAGGPSFAYDHLRSVPLVALAPLAAALNVTFYSLQKGPAAQQARAAPAELKLIDWTDELKDFADTAALVANLDLVISVDTSVAHLAGAMAKPVWTLLPLVPDWRWMLNRADSPWYPTMRLFRQKTAAQWAPVIAEVASDLAKFPNGAVQPTS